MAAQGGRLEDDADDTKSNEYRCLRTFLVDYKEYGCHSKPSIFQAIFDNPNKLNFNQATGKVSEDCTMHQFALYVLFLFIYTDYTDHNCKLDEIVREFVTSNRRKTSYIISYT